MSEPPEPAHALHTPHPPHPPRILFRCRHPRPTPHRSPTNPIGIDSPKPQFTWWERWNGDTGDPSMNSYNHYAFGSVMAWVFRRVAGIDTDDPGFHHLVIRPQFSPALPTLHTEYDSPYGLITTNWTSNNHQFTIITPPNTTATITFPNGKPENVGSGTHTYSIQ